MLQFRLRALDIFQRKPMPTWPSADLSEIDFDNIVYYLRPTDNSAEKNWDDVPPYIKDTFDKLGIPEVERKFLAGVSAQYESEVVYHSIREDLEKQASFSWTWTLACGSIPNSSRSTSAGSFRPLTTSSRR